MQLNKLMTHTALILILMAGVTASAQANEIEKIILNDFQSEIDYAKKSKKLELLELENKIKKAEQERNQIESKSKKTLVPYPGQISSHTPSSEELSDIDVDSKLSKPNINNQTSSSISVFGKPEVELLKVFNDGKSLKALIKLQGQERRVVKNEKVGHYLITQITANSISYRNLKTKKTFTSGL